MTPLASTSRVRIATVVGVLIEVLVMLTVAKIIDSTRGLYGRAGSGTPDPSLNR